MDNKTLAFTKVALTWFLVPSCFAACSNGRDPNSPTKPSKKKSIEMQVAQKALNKVVKDIALGDAKTVILSKYSSMKGTHCTIDFLHFLSKSSPTYKGKIEWSQIKKWCVKYQDRLTLSPMKSWSAEAPMYMYWIEGTKDKYKPFVIVYEGKRPHTWRVSIDAGTDMLDVTS